MDQRGQLLRAAVGFAGCSMPFDDLALWALRTWLDSWTGVGHVAVGMHRQGYDLQLTQYEDRGRRPTFDTTGMETRPRARPAPRGSGDAFKLVSYTRAWSVAPDPDFEAIAMQLDTPPVLCDA